MSKLGKDVDLYSLDSTITMWIGCWCKRANPDRYVEEMRPPMPEVASLDVVFFDVARHCSVSSGKVSLLEKTTVPLGVVAVFKP